MYIHVCSLELVLLYIVQDVKLLLFRTYLLCNKDLLRGLMLWFKAWYSSSVGHLAH
jgi:hypothetical protein